MKVIAYLAATGTQSTIERLKAASAMASGIVKTYQPRAASATPTWHWRSRRKSIEPDEVERSIDDFLSNQQSILREIKRARSDLADAYLMLIVRYDDGESARGISLSRDAVRVLAEINAGLEVDVVSVLDESLE